MAVGTGLLQWQDEKEEYRPVSVPTSIFRVGEGEENTRRESQRVIPLPWKEGDGW